MQKGLQFFNTVHLGTECNLDYPAWFLRKGNYIIEIEGQDVEDFENPRNKNQGERRRFQSGFLKNAGERGRKANKTYWWHGAPIGAGLRPILIKESGVPRACTSSGSSDASTEACSLWQR